MLFKLIEEKDVVVIFKKNDVIIIAPVIKVVVCIRCDFHGLKWVSNCRSKMFRQTYEVFKTS